MLFILLTRPTMREMDMFLYRLDVFSVLPSTFLAVTYFIFLSHFFVQVEQPR